MLNVDDLKTIDKIPNEKDISLSLYAKFYESFLAHKFYKINLENGTYINMNITPSNFPHLIGLHKFFIPYESNNTGNRLLNDVKQLKNFDGFLNLLHGKITIDDLKKVKDVNGDYVYDYYRNRILSVPFIYQIIEKSNFISFDKSKLRTNINGEFAFFSDIDKNRLHLFIKLNENNIKFKDTYFPLTFIDKNISKADYDRYTKGQTILKINSIEISDFETKKIEKVIRYDTDLAKGEVAVDKEDLREKPVTKAQLNYLIKNDVNIIGKTENGFNRFIIKYKESEQSKVDKALKKYNINRQR